MEKKTQHFVPKSYLTAWCDPTAPSGQTYVWRHTRDGDNTKNKDPKNIFWEPDYYTMPGPNGERDLWLEDALSKAESHFPEIRNEILVRRQLPAGDSLGLLCVYAALMLNRVKSVGEHFKRLFGKIHQKTLALENHQGAPRSTSLETEYFVSYGHHFVLAQALKTILPNLFQMQKVLIFAGGNSRFITSDRPCFLHDPKAYQLPPFYRSPGFARKTVELRFPLAPEVMLVASWAKMPSSVNFADYDVEELNRGMRFECSEYFVTQTNRVNPIWFDAGQEPDDSWEKAQAHKLEFGELKKGQTEC